jgi:hypothetical protein
MAMLAAGLAVGAGLLGAESVPAVESGMKMQALLNADGSGFIGGWDGEGDFLQLAACRGERGTNCTTLTDSHYVGSCPEGSVVLDPAFIGDYLRVADQRRGAGPHYVQRYASGSPYGARGGVWEVSPITSAVVVGRIAPPVGPRRNGCGFPP